MTDFRYNSKALDFEDALVEEFAKAAVHDVHGEIDRTTSKEDAGLSRIASGTAEDDVAEMRRAAGEKRATDDIAELRLRAKLAGIRDRDRVAVQDFLTITRTGRSE